MNIDLELHEKLLQLHYDLLPADEAAELRRQIDADPSLAAAYSEVQRQAELLGEAARLHVPKIQLQRPEHAMPAPKSATTSTASARKTSRRPAASARAAGWFVGIAAAALLALSVGGYWHHHASLADIAQEHMRLVVSGPATLRPGIANHYHVSTTAVTGVPLRAVVDYTLYSPRDAVLFSAQMPTDEQGHLVLDLPAEVDMSLGGRLEVKAEHAGAQQQIEPLLLAAEPGRFVTRLSLDKPLYRPGEAVLYRSLTFDRYGLAAESEMLVEFEIHDPSGAVVQGSQLQGATQSGVGSGAFAIPADLAGGSYTLVSRSMNGAFPEERREFFIRQYRTPRFKKQLEFVRDSYSPGDQVVADFSAESAQGDALAGASLEIVASVDGVEVFRTAAEATSTGAYRAEFTLPENIERGDGQLLVVVDDGGGRETIANTIPINLGKVDVQFFPEGGDLVAGVDNQVYFSGRDLMGEPVYLKGHVVDGRGKQIVDIETEHEGMGSFAFEPSPGETYWLDITEPADVVSKPQLPAVAKEQAVALSLPQGVIAAGEPLSVNVRSMRPHLPLVVAVTCRGVPVGQHPLAADKGDNAFEIPLPDEAGGVLRVTVYDYHTQPPRPVAERLAYRRQARRLNVELAGASASYAPGDPVELSLRVTDEQGEPAAAVLGVTVVDDALLNLADDKSPSMRTHFLLTTDVENPADLEDADFYLSDDPDAERALDLLLGTQGWRRFVEQTVQELRERGAEEEQFARLLALDGVVRPPAVSDNLDQVRAAYQASAARFSADRAALLGGLSVIGGAALLLLLLLTVLMRLVRSVELGLPALAAAAASLVFGAWLLGADAPASLSGGPVAYNAYRLTPRVVTADDQRPDRWYDNYWAFDDDLAFGDRGHVLFENDAEFLEDGRRDPFLLGKRFDELRRAEGEEGAELGDPLDMRGKRLAEFPAIAPPHLQRDLKLDFAKRVKDMKQLAGREFDWAHFRFDPRFGQDRLAGLAGFGGGGFADKEIADYRFAVRQYAHVHMPTDDGVRSDFTETLFWHPLLVADADGRATVSFQLSDSITSFRVLADAHGSGRIGSGDGAIVSRLPFNLAPKLPLAVTAGDRVDVPLAVVNDTDRQLPVTLTLEHDELLSYEGPADGRLQLMAGRRDRQYFALEVIGDSGQAELTFRGEVETSAGHRLTDAVRRSVKVAPPGFPIHLSYGGCIEGEQEVVVRLPDDWVPGSLQVTLNAFPSTLADLEQGLEGILREPTGCFEQASTSNYPNVLSLKYMQEHDVADPEITRRARQLLTSGYGRLTGYECPQQGYEWFGGDPGHEALSAYGLMQFRDMAAVYDVDQAMIQRTAKWLLSRRDGHGGFLRNEKALDSFGGAPDDVTNAYITWALSESGQEGIDAEIAHVGKLCQQTDDPYVTALGATSLLNAGRREAGLALLDKLAQSQHEDGQLTGTQGSITHSGGISLTVETTALAALAWFKEPAFREPAERAIRWITANRQGGGGFGSTQATILALKALVEHANINRGTITGGELIVKRDGVTIGTQPFCAGTNQTITIDGLSARLESGENRLAIALSGDNQMPYGLDVSYRSQTPASDDACPLRLSAELAADKVTAGESVQMTARLTNTTESGQPMSIAILGLPAGLEPRADQLEELKKAGKFDYYETREREIICYWRSLAPEQEVIIDFDLVAEIPGRYTAPASRAYLYYTAERKQWVAPLAVEIARP